MNIGELFVSLGFDVDDDKLEQFNTKIVGARNELLKMSAIATGAVYALNAFMESSGMNAVKVSNFAEQMGVTTDAIQKFQAVVHKTNPAVGLDEAFEKYNKFSQYLTGIKKNGEDATALSRLGVSNPYANAEEVLRQLQQHMASNIATMGVDQVSALLDQIGLGRGTLQAVSIFGTSQYDALAQGSVIKPEDLEALKKYEQFISDVDVRWQVFRAHLTAGWAPNLIDGFQRAADAAEEFYKNLSAVGNFIGQHKTAFEALAAVLAPLIAAWGIATFPITAAFAAMAVAVNDVGKALRGLPSFTGDTWDALKTVVTKDYWHRFAKEAPKEIDHFLVYKLGVGVDSSNRGSLGSNVTLTNNFHIHSNGDPNDVAGVIGDYMQRVWNGAHPLLNNGPVR